MVWLFISHAKYAFGAVGRTRFSQRRILLAAAIGASAGLLIVNLASFEFRVLTSVVTFIFWTGLLIQLGSQRNWMSIPVGAFAENKNLRTVTITVLAWLLTFGCLYTGKNIQGDHLFTRGKLYRDRGYARIESGRLEEALRDVESGAAYFKKATEVSPYNGLAFYELGQVLGKLGEIYLTKIKDPEKAENFYHHALPALLKAGREYQYKGLYYVLGKSHAFLYYIKKHPLHCGASCNTV